jgi:hypothetical protein
MVASNAFSGALAENTPSGIAQIIATNTKHERTHERLRRIG